MVVVVVFVIVVVTAVVCNFPLETLPTDTEFKGEVPLPSFSHTPMATNTNITPHSFPPNRPLASFSANFDFFLVDESRLS